VKIQCGAIASAPLRCSVFGCALAKKALTSDDASRFAGSLPLRRRCGLDVRTVLYVPSIDSP
jgi:hypothetical protein